ncbi:Metallophosphoesterase [Pandoravirus kuranda]|uniref:Metallophosphoesterase n=1 Tax=Pandoravirus kuranda TaxID=3019033 RepID=A0AA95EDE0_9VIRU|nr:Metallophosphoesterase [Pandoravirus kuranda]
MDATAAAKSARIVRIQVASDLHIEFQRRPDFDKLVAPTSASVLILAGDIGSPKQPSYGAFLGAMAARYEHVIVIAGNHEYYGGTSSDAPTMADLALLMREACAPHANVHLLDDESVVIDGVRYVGSTLWSRIPDALARRCAKDDNDYHYIRTSTSPEDNNGDQGVLTKKKTRRPSPWTFVDTYADGEDDQKWRGPSGTAHGSRPTKATGTGRLTVDDTNALHAVAVEFIRQETADAAATGDQPVVVITHHAPSFKSIHKRYATSLLTCAFVTDLERLMKPPMALWVHGHTHTASDYCVPCDPTRPEGGPSVRVVNNPLGYAEERLHSGYVADKVIEITVVGGAQP